MTRRHHAYITEREAGALRYAANTLAEFATRHEEDTGLTGYANTNLDHAETIIALLDKANR